MENYNFERRTNRKLLEKAHFQKNSTMQKEIQKKSLEKIKFLGKRSKFQEKHINIYNKKFFFGKKYIKKNILSKGRKKIIQTEKILQEKNFLEK